MSQPLNSMFLTGRVTGPCDVKTSKAGKPYCSFKFLSQREMAGKTEDTEINCMAFGGMSDRIAANVRMPMFISGRLRTERWEYQGKNYSKLVLSVDDAYGLLDLSLTGTPEASQPAPIAAESTDQPPF